jgi:hypothetical protein
MVLVRHAAAQAEFVKLDRLVNEADFRWPEPKEASETKKASA